MAGAAGHRLRVRDGVHGRTVDEEGDGPRRPVEAVLVEGGVGPEGDGRARELRRAGGVVARGERASRLQDEVDGAVVGGVGELAREGLDVDFLRVVAVLWRRGSACAPWDAPRRWGGGRKVKGR